MELARTRPLSPKPTTRSCPPRMCRRLIDRPRSSRDGELLSYCYSLRGIATLASRPDVRRDAMLVTVCLALGERSSPGAHKRHEPQHLHLAVFGDRRSK